MLKQRTFISADNNGCQFRVYAQYTGRERMYAVIGSDNKISLTAKTLKELKRLVAVL